MRETIFGDLENSMLMDLSGTAPRAKSALLSAKPQSRRSCRILDSLTSQKVRTNLIRLIQLSIYCELSIIKDEKSPPMCESGSASLIVSLGMRP